MGEWQKILYTSIITLIGGIILYLATRIIEGFVLKPVDKWLEVKGRTSDRLFFYSNIYTNVKTNPSPEEIRTIIKINEEFRDLAGQLVRRVNEIKWFRLFNYLGLIPSKSDIEIAQKKLIFLSNNLVQSPVSNRNAIEENFNASDEIKKRLRI